MVCYNTTSRQFFNGSVIALKIKAIGKNKNAVGAVKTLDSNKRHLVTKPEREGDR